MNPDSHHLKEALMHYFRFKRQWICADEVRTGNWFIADVLADTGKWNIEVEIKTSKRDLITGEAKKNCGWRGRGKNKHDEWTTGQPNKFALCVPEDLSEVAEEWINKTNKNYGLFIYLNKTWVQDRIWNKKTAKTLHKEYGKINYRERIAKRLSSCRAFELSNINNRKTLNES